MNIADLKETVAKFDDYVEEAIKFLRHEFSKCSPKTLEKLCGEDWRFLSSHQKQRAGKQLTVDLAYDTDYFRVIVAEDTDGQEIGFTLPFDALEEGTIREIDNDVRVQAALTEKFEHDAKVAANKLANDAEYRKRREMYEKLREEFEHDNP